MTFGFFVKEALRSVNRNAIPSFAAVASVVVTVLVLGVFIPVVQATTGAANEVRGRVLVDVFMKTNATPQDLARVKARLQDTKDVGKIAFVSKQAAYEREKKRNPEAYALLGSNPLPDTFRLTPDNPSHATQLVAALSPQTPSGSRTVIDPAIGKVQNSREQAHKILTITKVVKVMMFLLVGLLVVASVLLISNTIRLSLFSRRREIEVMKLVGATDSFIRWPFVIEGVVLGALGGLVAVVMLGVGKVAFLDPIIRDFALLQRPGTIHFFALTAILLLAAVVVSALGSGLSLRRFLRV